MTRSYMSFVDFIVYVSPVIGVFFLLFAAVHFFKESQLKLSNKILVAFFVVLSGCCFGNSLKVFTFYTGNESLIAYYFPLDYAFFSSIGPVSYLYVQEILQKRKSSLLKSVLFHSVSVVPSVLLSIYFITLPQAERITILKENVHSQHWIFKTMLTLFLVQVHTYIFICHRQMQMYIKRSDRLKINSIELEIRWLSPFFKTILLGIFVSYFVCYISNSELIVSIHGLSFMLALFVYFFVKSIWSNGIFVEQSMIEQFENQTDSASLNKEQQPSARYNIDGNKASSIIDMLKSNFEEKKLYLNTEITILDVANHLEIPAYQISNALNQYRNINFTDYINTLRLEDAKKLLSDPSNNFTIEYIGIECGFGSKSTFNRVFKKMNGQTPSEFRKTP